MRCIFVKEIIKLDKTANLKQSNGLVEAKYKLTVREQKMVIAICSQIKSSDEDFPIVRIRAAELADFCNFSSTNRYNLVRVTARKLRSRTLEYKKPDGNWYITGWINSAEYLSDGTIEFTFDPKLKAGLLQLKAAYLSTNVAPLMKFNRDYSARLYFILKKMLKIHEFDYTLDFFRERFQLGKGYNLFTNLKNKIFDPALAEINEKSDINVSHEYIKEGRSYKKIHFIVTLKNPTELPAGIEKLTLPSPEPENNQLQEIIDQLIKRGIRADMAQKLVKEYDPERIKNNIQYAINHKSERTHNLAGLIIVFIQEDVAGFIEQEKQKAMEREKQRQLDRLQAYEMFHGKAVDEAPEETNEPTTNDLENELAEIEAELICRKGDQSGARLLNKIKSLGLSIEDVKAGKRK